jgi:photosystem II stability/assembly factor-like uncharacterized protein
MIEQTIPHNFVHSIALSPVFQRDQTCFAAQQSGLYRSVDAGKTWENMTISLSQGVPLAVQLVAFSPDFEHDRTIYATAHGGVLRSIDGGETWHTQILTAPPPFAAALVISPNYALDGKAFCATVEDGVFCTGDRGGHWAAWNFGLLDLHVLSLAISPRFSTDEIIIAGTESGIYRSKNGGRAWRPIDLPSDADIVTSLAFASDARRLFAGTTNGNLLRSTDLGATWTVLSQFDDGIDQITVSPDFEHTGKVLALSDSTLYISETAGEGWKAYHDSNDMGKLTCFAIPGSDSSSTYLFAGTAEKGVIIR